MTMSEDDVLRGGLDPIGEMSFKLRTPVNAVMGYSELLIEDAEEGGRTELVADLRKIHQAGRQLLALVNHIIVSSCVEDGRLHLRLESVFGANVRHELRTPVNAILGYSELLQELAEDQGQQGFTPDLRRIEAAAKNLLKHIDYFFAPGNIEGGRLRIESDSFSASVPRAEVPEAEAASPKGLRGRLLLVEDNDLNRDMMARRLERAGFQVDVAGSGADALAKLGKAPPDLMLLDIVLPDCSGVEIVKKIRGDRGRLELPIIMVTARDQSYHIIAAMEAGASDYITKPVDFPVSLARIRVGLSNRREWRKLTGAAEKL